MSEIQVGAVLGNTYRLKKELGRGGVGSVWVAEHMRLPKTVAVKVLRDIARDEMQVAERFRREAEVTSRLEHPNIVQIIDFNLHDNGEPYIVMELLRGRSLSAEAAHAPLPLPRVQAIAQQIALGLTEAHSQGVIHRDLKPGNIFICDTPDHSLHVKVLDFGISKILGSQSIETRDGTTVGTPQYMAPEQVKGNQELIGAATDQFSLATVIYELLTGKKPFTGDDAFSVMYQIANQPEVLVSEHRSELPDYVVTSLQRAMAKSPTERFDTVSEFVGALCNDTAFHATDTLPQVPAFDAGEGAAPPEDATPDQTIAQAEANEDKAPAVFRQQAIWGVLAALMIFGYVAYSHNSGNEDEPETTVTQNEKRAKTPARTKPRKPAAKESAQASPESAIVNVKPKERAEPAHEPRRTAEATEEASANPPLAGSPTGKTQRPPTRSNLPTDEAGSPPAEVKSVKPAATSQRKQPKHRPSGKRTPRPEESKPDASAKSVEVRAKLKLALAALNRGDLVNAERLTTQSTFIKKTATARSYYARIACRKRNWSLAKSYIKRLPKKLRTSTLNRCKKRGFPLVD